MRFFPHTPEDIRRMLDVIGAGAIDELFRDIPDEIRRRAAIRLPPGLGEQDVVARVSELAGRNAGAGMLCFLGGGAYSHYVPAVVDLIVQRAEMYSAYTPYQPEVSQGLLQATFEFQTLVATLFGLDVANASMYDGASATAEAALMALRLQRERSRIVMARSLHPEYRATVRTYLQGAGDIELVETPFAADGRVDPDALDRNLEGAAALIVGYPNFFGVIEDLASVERAASARGAMLVTATAEPLSLALIRPPGECGAAIAVGEGQSFGIPLSYGGPGLGLFATRTEHVRSMPGRLVGETEDSEGRRGYVLTLATREQHIRRERATSNICTNHGLTALAATVYLCLLGRTGLGDLARLNFTRAHRAARALCASGWSPAFSAPFFNEFAVRRRGLDAALRRARDAGMLAGLPLGRWYPELEDTLLVAVTETCSEEAVDRLVKVLAA